MGAFTEEAARNLSKSLREPNWLTRFRVDAYQKFRALPLEKSSLYTKYTHISKFDETQFSLSPGKETLDFRTFFKDHLSGKERNILLQGNETEIHAELDDSLAAKGVKLMTLHEAIAKNEDLVRNAFEKKIVSSDSDKYAAFANAFFNSGTFVHVPRDVVVDLPLRKMLLTAEPKNSIIDQTIIRAEEGSRLAFLEELYSRENTSASLVVSVVEVYAGAGAKVDLSSIQLLDDNAVYLTNKTAIALNDSKVTVSALFLGSGITRSRMNFEMNGRGAQVEGLEIFFTNSKQRFDFESNLLHNAPDSTGSTLARGTLKDESQSIFKGMIKIVDTAKNSRSYLAHHAMILDRRARSDGVPSLEIDTNEVKATHSASVAQIDPEQIFYLNARGLAEEEAKKMIVLGFLEPALARIPIEQTREGARFIIEGKWQGENRRMMDRETLIALSGEAGPEIRQTEDIFERHYKYRK